jgi:hypothetical protein
MLSERKTRLSELFNQTGHEDFNFDDKYVILSDQHKGYQQFDRNKDMYCRVLETEKLDYIRVRMKLLT